MAFELKLSDLKTFCKSTICKNYEYIKFNERLNSLDEEFDITDKLGAYSFVNMVNKSGLRLKEDALLISENMLKIISLVMHAKNLNINELSKIIEHKVEICEDQIKLYETICILNNLDIKKITTYVDKDLMTELDRNLNYTYTRLQSMVDFLKYSSVKGVLVGSGDNKTFYVLKDRGNKLFDLSVSGTVENVKLGLCASAFVEINSRASNEFLFNDNSEDGLDIKTLKYTVGGSDNVIGYSYFPIFIASVVFRRKLHCEGKTWCLQGDKMSVADYTKWLKGFLDSDIKTYLLKRIAEDTSVIYLEHYNMLNNVLMTYAVVKDFNLPGKMSYIYSFGMQSESNEKINNLIEDRFTNKASDNSIASKLVGGNSEIQSIADGWQTTKGNKLNAFGKISIFTCNLSEYYGLTSFAYKQYAEMLKNGDEPTIDRLFLGKTDSDSLMEINIGSSTDLGIFITAGTRSGKGVLTLNVLAGLAYIGCPLIYADNKPDMSAMLWGIEKELNAKFGRTDGDSGYIRILGIEGTKPDFQYAGDNYDKLGRNSTRVKKAYNKYQSDYTVEIRGGLAYLKTLQLYLCSALKMPLIDEKYAAEKTKFIGVFDELNNATNRINSILSMIKMDEKLQIPEKASDTHKKLGNYILKLKENLDGAINADFGKSGRVYMVCIAQDLRGNNDKGNKGYVKANIITRSLVSMMSVRIYGKNGNLPVKADSVTGKDDLRLTAGTTSEAVIPMIEIVQGNNTPVRNGKAVFGKDEDVSRRFVVVQGKSTEVFAPLFTFPGNDIEIAVTSIGHKYLSDANYNVKLDDDFIDKLANTTSFEDSSDVGTFLGVKKKSGEDLNVVIRRELVEELPDGSYIKNEKIGYLGLLRMLFKHKYGGDPDDKILETLGQGYDICWKYLCKTGLVDKYNYECVEDYIYDPNIETFLTNTELNDLFESGRSNSSTDEEIIIVNDVFEESVDETEESGTDGNENKESVDENMDDSDEEIYSLFDNTDEETDNGVSETYDNESDNGFEGTGETDGTSGFGRTDESFDYTGTEQVVFNTGEDEVIQKCKTCGYMNGSGVGNPCRHCGGDPNVRGRTWICSNCHSRMSDRIKTCISCGLNIDDSMIPQPKPENEHQSQPSPFSHAGAATYNDTEENSYTEPYGCDFVFKDDNRFHIFGENAMMKQTSANLLSIIEEVVGNLSRVNNISIENGGHIIVNGIHINPSLTDEQIQQLPLDLRYKVSNGQWFELFHGKDLAKFRNLRQLIIADMSMADKVCLDTGKADVFKLRHWLERKTALNSLIVAGVEVREEEREYMEDAQRGNNFVNGVHGAFSGIRGIGQGIVNGCRVIRNSRFWNSGFGRFTRGVAAVAGVAVALPFGTGLISGLGFLGTLNLAIAGAGGVYNVVRHRNKGNSGGNFSSNVNNSNNNFSSNVNNSNPRGRNRRQK